MKFNDYYLKFNDEEEWEAVKELLENAVIDVIGNMYENDAEYDSEGKRTKEPTLIEGYYVNLRLTCKLPPELEIYTVHPNPPKRSFL
jgi:hypothetical protein